MLPALTKTQIDQIIVTPETPLLICDVDEVVVHFVSDFEDYLRAQKLRFNLSGFHLDGNSVSTVDGTGVGLAAIHQLLADFFAHRTLHMQPIAGAIDAIKKISLQAEVVFLTNLPFEAGDARRQNMQALGLPFPVITNTGPKGPAIRALASQTTGPVAFVDDSPGFIRSSYEYAPHVQIVHFLQDERFLPHVPDFDFIGLRSNNWAETQSFLLRALVRDEN
jgi:hypothetical protein